MTGKPKCFQCKEEKKGRRTSRYKTCGVCLNRFKTYDVVKNQDWTCYSCLKGDKLIVTSQVNVFDLVQKNTTMVSKPLPDNVKCMKYSDKLTKLDGLVWRTPDRIQVRDNVTTVTTTDVIIDRIKALEGETVQCGICFDDFSHHQLTPICGNDGCKTKSCRKCLETLYNNNKPGCIFNADLCPYCRQTPDLRTIKSVNKDLFKMLNLNDCKELDSKMYHFWCKECNTVKPYIQRECAMATPELSDQVCVDCVGSKDHEIDDDHLKCPDCGILVEHVDGCNHMTCMCGCHFCVICRDTWPDGSSIYEHYDEGVCPMYGSVGQF